MLATPALRRVVCRIGLHPPSPAWHRNLRRRQPLRTKVHLARSRGLSAPLSACLRLAAHHSAPAFRELRLCMGKQGQWQGWQAKDKGAKDKKWGSQGSGKWSYWQGSWPTGQRPGAIGCQQGHAFPVLLLDECSGGESHWPTECGGGPGDGHVRSGGLPPTQVEAGPEMGQQCAAGKGQNSQEPRATGPSARTVGCLRGGAQGAVCNATSQVQRRHGGSQKGSREHPHPARRGQSAAKCVAGQPEATFPPPAEGPGDSCFTLQDQQQWDRLMATGSGDEGLQKCLHTATGGPPAISSQDRTRIHQWLEMQAMHGGAGPDFLQKDTRRDAMLRAASPHIPRRPAAARAPASAPTANSARPVPGERLRPFPPPVLVSSYFTADNHRAPPPCVSDVDGSAVEDGLHAALCQARHRRPILQAGCFVRSSRLPGSSLRAKRRRLGYQGRAAFLRARHRWRCYGLAAPFCAGALLIPWPELNVLGSPVSPFSLCTAAPLTRQQLSSGGNSQILSAPSHAASLAALPAFGFCRVVRPFGVQV